MTQPFYSRASLSAHPWTLALALLAAFMLLATAFYPFGYDQAVFSTAGEMILHGAIPYRDFLDTKPPLIFYLYALALGIIGRHEWSVHLFDIIYQLIAAYYFYRILRRKFSADFSLIAVSLTIILYAGSGFWMTVQAESFATLPSLLLLDITIRTFEMPSRAIFYGLLAGAAIILLLLLKFTLVMGAVAAMLFLLFSRTEFKTKWRFSSAVLLSSAVLTTVFIFALWQVGALDRFLQSLAWLQNYAAIRSVQHPLFEELFLIFPERIIYSMSVSLFMLAAWGIVRWFRESSNDREPLLLLLLITFFAQLFGILAERKIEFPYQYTRALWAITPFMTLGLWEFAGWAKQFWKSVKFGRSIVSVLSVLLVLLLSPLPRIVTQTIAWIAISLERKDAAAEVQRRIPNYFAEDEQQVADYLKASSTNLDRLFFWGNDVAIYFFSDKLPQTICLTATPFRTAFTPQEWRVTLLQQLAAAPPKYFVVEFGDSQPAITGSALDSYQALLQWNELKMLLMGHYASDTTIGQFHIFHWTDESQ